MWGEVIADIAFNGNFTCIAVEYSPPCTVEQECNAVNLEGTGEVLLVVCSLIIQ